MDPAQLVYQQSIIWCQAFQQMTHLFTLVSRVIVLNIASIIQAHYLKEHHTPILTGHMWVLGLLGRHPEHIHTELGVHHHIFYAIVDELLELGHLDSRFVTLEEQLVIFLYCSVTGLTIRHLGESFQRPNDTITLWALQILYIRVILKSFKLFQENGWYFLLTTKSHETPNYQQFYSPRDTTESKIMAIFQRCPGCNWWESHQYF